MYKGCIWAATQESQSLGFLTISDTNQNVLSQKKARSLDRRGIVNNFFFYFCFCKKHLYIAWAKIYCSNRLWVHLHGTASASKYKAHLPQFCYIKVVYKGCIWAATQESQSLGFLTISDTNQNVLSQKKARSFDISRRGIVNNFFSIFASVKNICILHGQKYIAQTDCGYTSMELPRRANIRHIYPSFAI